MELTSPKFKNFHTKWTDTKNKPIETMSIGDMKKSVDWMIDACKMNSIDPNNVPVFISLSDELFIIQGCSFGNRGDMGYNATIQTCGNYDKLFFVAPDTEDPASTEVEWKSRGVSDGLDVSGYVNSRPSGVRLLHMAQELLGIDDPKDMKSWLDYRESEPNYIQFKFSAKEFDVNKIDELSKQNGGKLSKAILKQCLR